MTGMASPQYRAWAAYETQRRRIQLEYAQKRLALAREQDERLADLEAAYHRQQNARLSAVMEAA